MTKPSEYLRDSFREGWQVAELDPARSAQPLAITRHDGQTILVFKDPGRESWIGFLSGPAASHSI